MRWLSHGIGRGLLRNLAGRPRPEIVSQVEASSFVERNNVSFEWVVLLYNWNGV